MPQKTDTLGGVVSNFTPGPWSIEPGANSYFFEARIIAGDECVAFAEGDVHGEGPCGEGDGFEPSANAYLIAAAPDLLAIAERILDRGYVSEFIEEECGDHAQLVAAIAKARGLHPHTQEGVK